MGKQLFYEVVISYGLAKVKKKQQKRKVFWKEGQSSLAPKQIVQKTCD